MHSKLSTCKALILILVFLFSSAAQAAVVFIDIWEYRVTGNSILAPELIQQRLERFTGPARTIEDVEAAIELLTQEYRNAGYPAVYVEMPPQTVVNGVFRLAVTETKLRRVKVSEASYFLPSSIRKSVVSLEKGRPINLPRLQDDVQRLNTANPAMKVVPVLTQGPTQDTVDIELSVVDELPLQAALQVNNYSSSGTTDSRLQFELGYSNLWQKHHSWSFTAQTSPEETKEVRVISTSYVAPLDFEGSKLAAYAVKSNSETATVSDIRVVGDGVILGARYIHPVAQREGAISSLIAGFDYKDFDELLEIGVGQNTTTPIDYLSFSLQYSQVRRNPNWSDSFSVAVSLGIRGLFNENEEFLEKRSRGEANFSILKAEYERSYSVWENWLFDVNLEAQLTDTPLVSNEQFSAGGIGSVKAYYESQVSGDAGVSGGLTLTTPNLAAWAKKTLGRDVVKKLNTLAYLEGAYVSNQDSGIQEDSSKGISGWGLGLRSEFIKGIKINMDLAQALEDNGDIEQGDMRVTGQLRYEF